MPKYMIWIMVVVFLPLAIVGTLMAADLVKVQNSWVSAITKVRQTNEEQAPRIVAEDRSLREFQAALTQANLGWDRIWNEVPTTRAQQRLNVQIGANQGLAEGMILHAFKPEGNGFIYVGPFSAAPGSVRVDNADLVPAWALMQFSPYNNSAGEIDTWGGAANWRFRTMIPSANKIEFESSVARYQTNLQTLTDLFQTISKQDALLQAAQTQLDQREGELIGLNNPEVEEDPLRPELTKGLVAAIAEEEEARNVLELDIDELRKAILDFKSEIEAVEAELGESSASRSTPARLGSRQ